LLRERDSLMEKRRDKEMQIQALRRQKAIEQSVYFLIFWNFLKF